MAIAPGANQSARLNLASSIWPFYSEAAGRTVMLPEIDENFDRYNAANTVQDKGVPQVFYMHNTVPIANGFQSIGYDQQLTNIPGAVDFDIAHSLVNSDLSTFLFVPANGKNYIYDIANTSWVSTNPVAPNTLPTNTLVTIAFVKGTYYIYYANYGCFSYNNSTKTMTPVILTGITVGAIIGICSANGYMIAWSSNAIFWSSLTDPTNFIPSIQTGSGGGSVQDAKGSINFCLSISGGFLIYCSKNIVGASYTANTSFPYIITEIAGSGGVSSIDKVAYQSNFPYHVALTTAGIQQISLNTASPAMPELSDFITAQTFEDFDETAVAFTYTTLSDQLYTRFAYISDRYMVLSYGVVAGIFTHAIVYDFGLNRYGKLKITHTCCFDYIPPSSFGYQTYNQLKSTAINSLTNTTYNQLFVAINTTAEPKKNIGFLQKDGTIYTVNFSIDNTLGDGVFIIGKLQYARNNVIIHQRTDVETIDAASSFKLYLLGTFDGKDFAAAIPTTSIRGGKLIQTFAKRYTASNISLCAVGSYNLTSIVVNFTVGGFR